MVETLYKMVIGIVENLSGVATWLTTDLGFGFGAPIGIMSAGLLTFVGLTIGFKIARLVI